MLQRYRCSTLVDITPTGVYRGKVSSERFQQSNYETLIQTISILTQPTLSDISIETISADDVGNRFGLFYANGEQKAWSFNFTTDHSDVFLKDGNPVCRLEEIFDKVPFISGLTETALFIYPVFFTEGELTNIVFDRIE